MSTFSLNGRIGLNVSDLVSNAEKARKAVSDVGDELDDVDAKKTEPTVSVDDKATAAIADIESGLTGLNGETAEPTVSVDDKATSQLDVIERDVAGLDGETAAPTVKIDDKASGELDDIEKQLKKDLPDAAGSGGKEASGNLASSFADLKGAGGAMLGGAIGAAIIGGLQLGMERIQVREQITQQFGLIEADAKRLGEQAADIYAGGWGEGSAAVMSSLALINQRLVETGIIGEQETAKIGEAAIVMAEVFGMDVNTVIEATSKLMLNGLAPDAETAMDLMATAMQQGGGAAGDLFESVDEYAQHFAAFGLSAEDMMALFVHGMQNGQRDTDKLADAVKEMRIRAIADTDEITIAYGRLGLNADYYRAKILEGGPAAKQAFGEIIAALRNVQDPMQRETIAVSLMGTQIEDLGINALDSFAEMGDGVEGFAGKVDEMNEKMTEAQSSSERMFRSFKEEAGIAGEEVAKLLETVLGLTATRQDLLDAEQELIDRHTQSGQAVDDLTEKTNKQGAALAEARRGMADYTLEVLNTQPGVEGLTDKNIGLTKTTEELKKATDDAADAIKQEEKRVKDLHERIVDLYEANIDLIGGQNDVTKAMWSANDAAADLDEVIAEGLLPGTREYEQALMDAVEAQDDAARAASDLEIAQRQANGETFSATEMNSIHVESLGRVASMLAPGSALRAGVDGLIEDYGNIPDKVETTVLLDTLDTEANLLLLSGMLDTATRPRTVRVTTTFDTGGFTGMLADGGPAKAGGTYLVGEQGPELVTFGQDSFVYNAAETSAIMARGAGSPAAAGIGVSGAAPRSMSNMATGNVTAGDVNVSVQIGQTELRDMIQDVVISHERQKELIR
jgi:phage-related minor tail protein